MGQEYVWFYDGVYQRFWNRLALGVAVLEVQPIDGTEYVAIVIKQGDQNGIFMFRAGKWGLNKVEFKSSAT